MPEPKPEHLIAEYSEVCQTHRMVTDFRGKLLALLPVASGTGVFLLITRGGDAVSTRHLLAAALFGFTVTLGLFLHELRGIKHCTELIGRGKFLENELSLGGGQFTDERACYSSWTRELIGPVGAAWLIYPAVLAAWMYLGAVGVGIIPAAASSPSTDRTVTADARSSEGK